jgi:ribosomal protein L29
MADKWPKASELRAMPDAELRTQLEKLTQDLWRARQKTAEGAQQQTHRFSALRRQIARVHTVLKTPRQPAASR